MLKSLNKIGLRTLIFFFLLFGFVLLIFEFNGPQWVKKNLYIALSKFQILEIQLLSLFLQNAILNSKSVQFQIL